MNILFVCRGNTCRSALAEVIARRFVGERATIRSAGTEAYLGSPASPGAREAAKQLGLDLERHRSQKLCRSLIQWADIIYTVTPERSSQIVCEFPSAAAKLRWIDPHLPLTDPIGSGVEVYVDLAKRIESSLRMRLIDLNLL